MMTKADLEIQIPPDSPKEYQEALIRSANQCAAKKHLETPPESEACAKAIE